MNITFYKEKLNPLSSLMTGATYWCKKQTAIVLVSDRQRNAASQKLMKLMILARYFIHVWIGVHVAHYLELSRSSQDDFCHYQDFIFQGSGEEENKKEEKAEEDEGRGRPGENAT